LKEWSGRWDSNPRLDLGKVPYYPYTTTAPKQQNFITTPLRRQDPIDVQRMARHPQGGTHPWRAQLHTARNPVLCCLADLKHARRLNDGRLPLPLGKLGSFGTVRVNTGKFLAVFVKNRNLPVLVLAPLVLPQLGAFSFFQCLYPPPYYLNRNESAQVPIRAIMSEQRECGQKSALQDEPFTRGDCQTRPARRPRNNTTLAL
jgi:hypothetical protein